jgi:hypothetical protein
VDPEVQQHSKTYCWKDHEYTYVLGEMACLVALAAFDTLSGARLGTLLGVMAILLAVLAGVGIDPLLGAVARTMPRLLAIYALDGGL